jgi:hypothetical protein
VGGHGRLRTSVSVWDGGAATAGRVWPVSRALESIPVCVGVCGGGKACVGEGVNDNGVEEPAKEGGDELGDDETLCKRKCVGK